MIGDIRRLILLPHIKVHNANALSSPFTIGFPAMTAWLGAIHALQRKVNATSLETAVFQNVAVVTHEMDLQTYKGTGDYVHSIIGTGNPLDKDGSRPAFIEEARCHLEVSLLIEYSGVDKDDEKILLDQISHHLHASMKIAGGDILSFEAPVAFRTEEGNDTDLRKLTRKLMPGYAIIERRELMLDAMKNGLDALDGLLDYLAVHHHCDKDDDGNTIWSSHRKTSGWIVPVATGFHGISELGQAKKSARSRYSSSVCRKRRDVGRIPHAPSNPISG